MIRARASAMIHAARLELRMRRARQCERDALARAGEFATSEPGPIGDACPAVLGEIRRLHRQLDGYSAALAGSLDLDRADYLAVPKWMRPVVIARGVCARSVLRQHVARCRRELRPLYEQLGAAALAESSGAPGDLRLSPPLAEVVRGARAELASVAAERTRRLEPFQGKACPALVSAVAEEGKAFGRALVKQLHGQLIPRASALAGLAAGWWVTHTYTTSRPRSLLRSLGIGSGGTHVVRAETYRTMRFWLPILAAAMLAYLGDRVARWLQQRYGPRDGST
jgi:hypothetical protein